MTIENFPLPESELLDELPLGFYMSPDKHVLARAPLGLTAYLDHPQIWSNGGARSMLEVFLDRVPNGQLRFLSTSLTPTWRALDESLIKETLRTFEDAGALGTMRHLFWIKIANDPGAPGLGFSYTEFDRARSERASILELTLYEIEEPQLLLDLALELLGTAPVYSLIGGFCFRYDQHERAVAFEQIYRWASRHVGIDVQMPEEMSWLAPKVVTGTNWLNYIGGGLADRAGIDLESLRGHAYAHDVRLRDVADGLLLQAGEQPLQGDLNRFHWPFAYAEVARLLAPYFPERVPELWGPFFRDNHTEAWFRRLVDPEAWVERRAPAL